MSAEIKPCAFCGSKDKTYAFGKILCQVRCRGCNSGGPTAKTIAEAIAAWNAAWEAREKLADALNLAINTVECASIDISDGPTKGQELPWYRAANAAIALHGGCRCGVGRDITKYGHEDGCKSTRAAFVLHDGRDS